MNKLLSVLLLVTTAICYTSAAAVVTSATNPDLITDLPGLNFNTSYKQYSGYLNGGDGKKLHYWFTEAQSDPLTSPLLLWLNGGPGCSSLDGLLNELGPIHVNDDGKTLYENKYSWNTFANVLFLESPACVGFSYSEKNDCQASDNSTATANYNALLDWFKRFPEYRKNPFFVTGESYGGVYVPTLSLAIVENNKTFPINLRGFAVGNGITNWSYNDDSLIFFGNYHGLIGRILWDSLIDNCCKSDIPTQETCKFSGNRFPACNTKVTEAMDIMTAGGLNIYNLYGYCAHSNDTSFSRYHADRKLLHRNNNLIHKTKAGLGLDPPCTDSSTLRDYLNRADVREALHIPTSVDQWQVCNDEVNENYQIQYTDMGDVYRALYAAGIRGLVYNGDVDMACNFIGDQWFVEGLNYREIEARRAWYSADSQVGGYVKRFKGLDLLTVRGSGHMVPQDKPEPALRMIKAFVFNRHY